MRLELDKRIWAMTHAELVAAIGELARDLGVLAFYVPDSRRVRGRGMPDYLLIGRSRILFREVKTETGTRSTDQTRVGYRIGAARGDYAIWRPSDWYSGTVEAQLRQIMTH